MDQEFLSQLNYHNACMHEFKLQNFFKLSTQAVGSEIYISGTSADVSIVTQTIIIGLY